MAEEKMIDVLAELKALCIALEKEGIPFCLFGGWAVAVYGFLRYTDDIDIQILREDLERTKACLRANDFIIDNGIIPLPSQGIEFYRMGKIIGNEMIVIDIQFVDKNSDYWRRRQRFRWNDINVWVLKKEDLIEMKRKSTRGKDRLDVEELERIQPED